MPNSDAANAQISADNLPKETFKLGNLTVDPQTRRIANKDQSLACEPSVFNLLLYFCAHSPKNGESGEIISRDQMIADVWKGRVVSDNAINRKIYQLRKELAILDSENEYIETVTKYGYRLSHPITSVNPQAPILQPQLPTPNKTQYQWLFTIIGVILLLIMMSQWSSKPQQRQPPKLKQLTSLQGIESDASLSPDGKNLLFSFSENGQGRQLILQHTVSGKRQTLSPASSNSPQANSALANSYDIRGQWHPSGKKIAFVRINNDINEPHCVIYLMTITPKLGEATKLRECAAANLPSLTWGENPNQLFLAERVKKTQPYIVYSLDIATGNKIQLTLPFKQNNMRGDYFVRRNVKGDKIALLRYNGSNEVTVGIYNSESFTLEREFVLDAHINGIAWHPVTEDFYFRRGQHVYRVNNSGEEQQQVFHVGSAFGGLSFSNDGSQLLMSSSVNDTDIWQKPITPKNTDTSTDQPSTSFIGSTRKDSRPRYANTSKALAFISNRSGKNAFWLRAPNGQTTKMADLDIDTGYPNFVWSPDDSKILFEYQEQIYTMQLSTGKLTVVLDKSFEAYTTSWSSDGKKIYYGSTKSGDWQLWSYNLADKTSKQLTFNGGYSGYDNPEDGLFYYSKYHQDGLWQTDANGKEQLIIEDFSLLNWLNWRIVDGKAYYANLSAQDPGVYSVDLASKESVQVLKQTKGVLHDYSISKGGETVAYTKHISQSGDVLALVFP